MGRDVFVKGALLYVGERWGRSLNLIGHQFKVDRRLRLMIRYPGRTRYTEVAYVTSEVLITLEDLDGHPELATLITLEKASSIASSIRSLTAAYFLEYFEGEITWPSEQYVTERHGMIV